MDEDFSRRRAQSLARICAYTLLGIFLISLLAAALPLPMNDPGRAMGMLAEVLERSTLPLVAVLFLYFGMAEEALPASWECRLALWMGPLLRLAALSYLLTAVAVLSVSQRLDSLGVSGLNQQLKGGTVAIERLRQGVENAPDAPALKRLLSSQPALRQALVERGTAIDDRLAEPERRRQLLELIDRAGINLRLQGQQTRATASGNLARQSLRLTLTALVYALFYLLAGFIWPRSVVATLVRIREARQARMAEESEP